MNNTELRFVNGYGGMMVKFCENHIVIAFRDWPNNNEAALIPYEYITKLTFSSWSGLQITTKDNWSTSVYIQEKKQIQLVIKSVIGKINQPTQKKRGTIKLTNDDIKFIEIASKKKRNEPVTEQEELFLGSCVGEQYDNTKKGKFQNRMVLVLFIVIVLAAVIFLGNVFGGFGSSSHSSNASDSEYKDGFIGSDGKYHEYIPEFGDDVNNWMEENW